MTDNEFWTIITTVLGDALTAASLTLAPTVEVKLSRSYQPRQQGTDDNPLLVFHTIFSKRYGWQGKKDKYNETTEDIDHTESWILERTIQVNAQVYEDPSQDYSTAFDIVDQIAAILQEDSVRKSLINEGIGILKITDLRTPFIQDDEDRFVQVPSFDFVVNYGQTRVSTVDPLTEIITEIQRV